MKYEFCEENEVVIQEFLASQLRQLFDLKASRSGFCRWRIPFSQYFLDKRDKRKSRRFYLRIYHVFHICVLNNRPPVSEHQTKKKGLWPSRFPKPGNSITFYVSFCQAWEKCLRQLQRPLLYEKRWVGDSLTKLRNLPHENFSLKKKLLTLKLLF